MKEVYNTYLTSHFLKLNPPTKGAFESVAKAYALWYKKFLPLNKDVRILDIGCGMGHFLYFLKKEGYTNFFGVDISKQQVDFVKQNITKNVALADAFDFLKKNQSFRLIVANDIIEHIPKEKLLEFMHLIFNSLEKNGLVFIKTDNMSNPFGLRGRYMDITHEIGFTEHSLHQLLATVGFQDILLLGADCPVIGIESLMSRIGGKIIYFLLKVLFRIQGFPNPKILTKDIIAIAKKS